MCVHVLRLIRCIYTTQFLYKKKYQEETTCSSYATKPTSTSGHVRVPRSLSEQRCKNQHAGRTAENDRLYRQEDKDMMVTQDKEHNIRIENYSLEVMTSYFLLEGTRAQMVLIRGAALVIASSNNTQPRS